MQAIVNHIKNRIKTIKNQTSRRFNSQSISNIYIFYRFSISIYRLKPIDF